MLQHQVQAVAPFVLQQYSSDSIQAMLFDVSLVISLLTNRKTRGLIMILNSKGFLDRLVNTLEEKKRHEIKLKEGLKDLAFRCMELQNSLSSSWPKQMMVFLVSGPFDALFGGDNLSPAFVVGVICSGYYWDNCTDLSTISNGRCSITQGSGRQLVDSIDI